LFSLEFVDLHITFTPKLSQSTKYMDHFWCWISWCHPHRRSPTYINMNSSHGAHFRVLAQAVNLACCFIDTIFRHSFSVQRFPHTI